MTPKELIESVFAAFQRGDIPYIVKLSAPDAVWKQSALLPWGGEYRGPEGAGQFFALLDRAMETTAFDVHEVIQVGAEVFAFGYYEAKGRSTGKKGGSRWAFRWRVEGGQIAAYEAYLDTAALLAALA